MQAQTTLEQLKARNEAVYAAYLVVHQLEAQDELLGITTESTFSAVSRANLTAARLELAQSWRIGQDLIDAKRFEQNAVAAAIAEMVAAEPTYWVSCGCGIECAKDDSRCPQCGENITPVLDQGQFEVEVA